MIGGGDVWKRYEKEWRWWMIEEDIYESDGG